MLLPTRSCWRHRRRHGGPPDSTGFVDKPSRRRYRRRLQLRSTLCAPTSCPAGPSPTTSWPTTPGPGVGWASCRGSTRWSWCSRAAGSARRTTSSASSWLPTTRRSASLTPRSSPSRPTTSSRPTSSATRSARRGPSCPTLAATGVLSKSHISPSNLNRRLRIEAMYFLW